MALSVSQQRNLQRLIDDKIDNDISESDFQKLTNWLTDNEDARDYYVDYVGLHAGLNWEFNSVETESLAPTEPVQRFSWAPVIAIAAMLLLAGLWFTRHNGVDREIRTTTVVAEILSEHQAEWSLKSDIPQSGAWLPSGELDLRSGHLRIRLASGVQLDLVGPCIIDLNSADAVALEKGMLVAEVPFPARGFTVSTPQGRVVDLGTIFAMTVSAGSGTAVHVKQGLVTVASPSGKELTRVEIGEAVQRVNATVATASVAYNDDLFSLLRAPATRTPYNYVHWGFDQRNQGEILDLGNLPTGPFPAILSSNRLKAKAAWPKSPFGKGFAFNGTNESLESQLPGISGAQPRTVALWVKAPKNLSHKNSYALVGWGVATSGTKGKKWLLTINRKDTEGKLGCFRTEFGGGYLVGNTDLRDGAWHHLASVWEPGESDDVSKGLRLYVDGKLESVSGSNPERVDTQIAGPKTHMIRIGANLPIGPSAPKEHFRGVLDEIFVINRALSQAEVQLLMDTNSL